MISVIVPVWNDRESLEALLPWLMEEPGSSEIIVVDGGSRDGSVEAARRFPSVRLVESERGRGCQMNRGAGAARGDVLLFLHCDTRPSHGAIASLPELLDSRGADFGAFRLRFDPPGRLPTLLAFFTRLARPWSCFGDQGIFVRREFFRATGGFPDLSQLGERVVHEVLEVTDRAGCVTARQRQWCRVVNLGRQTDAARQLPNVLGRVEQVRFARGQRRQRQTRVV